jgi:histidinol-phosphate phosphatase family protein
MKAVFLDRDGTIIVEPPGERLIRKEDTKLFPDTLEALKLLADNGFTVIIISNQAGIAEGLITLEDFERLNDDLIAMLVPSGVQIAETFICPHESADNCDCRKPKPKMILDAAAKYSIDLEKSFMVGDRRSDVQAGLNAGTKTILVETAATPQEAPEATYTAPNLLAAVQYVVNGE